MSICATQTAVFLVQETHTPLPWPQSAIFSMFDSLYQILFQRAFRILHFTFFRLELNVTLRPLALPAN